MNVDIITALAAAIGTVLGAVGTLYVIWRKAPSEAALIAAQANKAKCEADIADAQADKAQAEANRMLLDNLRAEIDRQKGKLIELDQRQAAAEQRATNAEVRLAEAETRSGEFRRAVIVVGERLDSERRNNRETTEKLCVMIEYLLDCIANPERIHEVDATSIQRLIANIRGRRG